MNLKKGTWILTLTKKLPQPEEINTPIFECVMSIKRQMSWGLATVHIQRKIH